MAAYGPISVVSNDRVRRFDSGFKGHPELRCYGGYFGSNPSDFAILKLARISKPRRDAVDCEQNAFASGFAFVAFPPPSDEFDLQMV